MFDLIDFSESIWIFHFFTYMKITFLKKNWHYNRATTRKILVCDMISCYKNISKIRNVTFIFKSFQNNFQKRKKKLEKIHMDFEKSTNVFEIKQGSHLIWKTWNRSWNFHELVEISFVHQKKINKLLTLNRSENMYIFFFCIRKLFLDSQKKRWDFSMENF